MKNVIIILILPLFFVACSDSSDAGKPISLSCVEATAGLCSDDRTSGAHCEKQADGTYKTVQVSCSDNQECVDGYCRTASCDLEPICETPGEQICVDETMLKICGNFDDDSCYEWRFEDTPENEELKGVCKDQIIKCIDGAWITETSDHFQKDETWCDGYDNDCDGITDEGCFCVEGEQRPCGVNIGLCQQGTETCSGSKWGACTGKVDPVDEQCDGEDNNCNGETDEHLTPQDATLNKGICLDMKKICSGKAGWIEPDYTLIPGYEAEESSCDGKDNDCDGEIDEGCSCVDGVEEICGSDVGACKQGTRICTDGVWGECAGEITGSDELYDGIDNDCNGTIDDGWPAIDGLIAYLPFDDDLNDRVPERDRDYTITEKGGDSFKEGKVGNAVELSGDNSYLKFPEGFDDFTSGLTVSIWVKFHTMKWANWIRIFDFANGDSNHNIILSKRYTFGDVIGQKDYDLAYQIYHGGSDSDLSSNNILQESAWLHLTLVHHPDKTVKIYLNGTEKRSGTLDLPDKILRTSNYLGRSNMSDPDFYGLFDELYIYNRALTEDEVKQLHQKR